MKRIVGAKVRRTVLTVGDVDVDGTDRVVEASLLRSSDDEVLDILSQ